MALPIPQQSQGNASNLFPSKPLNQWPGLVNPMPIYETGNGPRSANVLPPNWNTPPVARKMSNSVQQQNSLQSGMKAIGPQYEQAKSQWQGIVGDINSKIQQFRKLFNY